MAAQDTVIVGEQATAPPVDQSRSSDADRRSHQDVRGDPSDGDKERLPLLTTKKLPCD